MRKPWLCSLICLLLAAGAASALPTVYRLTDLGSLGHDGIYPRAINNRGQIIGGWSEGFFVWEPVSGIRSLPRIADAIVDMNNAGQILGMQWGDDDRGIPVIWDPVRGTKELDVPAAYYTAAANSINDIGQVTGTMRAERPYCDTRRGVIWEPDGGITDIGLYAGMSINNAGQVAGLMQGPYDGASSCGPTVAGMWDPVIGTTRIYTIPEWEGYQSFAWDINEAGVVVGETQNPYGDKAFIWSLEGGHTFLDDAVDSVSYAWAINDPNQVIGSFHDLWWSPSRPFVWEQSGGFTFADALIDPALGYTITGIEDINDRGWIIGIATLEATGDRVHGVLLRPGIGVEIDICPGNRSNPVNPQSNGATSVAILGSAEIDVSQIDIPTVTLADAPACKQYKPSLRDVNRDGFRDLVLHVLTREMRVGRGSTWAMLEGKLEDGMQIEGEDAISITIGRP